ncbi:MAG: hypothetical protein AAF004_06525 [Pseudomonadota bacterium]
MVELGTQWFHTLVIAHIVSGTIGLLTLWVPIVGRKGSALHKQWGKVFAYALLVTGAVAIGISICTLAAPLETHPQFDDAATVRGLFGWMMLYLAVMTINLAWYGLQCIRNRNAHERHRNVLTVFLQLVTFVAASNCFLQGWSLGQPLMMGIAVVGLAASVLNTKFIFERAPLPQEWLVQHTRGLVGAGISVYTAFLAFGAVNLLPAYALNPALWATPTIIGVAYLLYHQARIMRARQRLASAR